MAFESQPAKQYIASVLIQMHITHGDQIHNNLAGKTTPIILYVLVLQPQTLILFLHMHVQQVLSHKAMHSHACSTSRLQNMIEFQKTNI